MGCFESREEVKPGVIKFISHEDYVKDLVELKLVALDCSVDSFDGKTKAEELYKFQRVTNALYFNLNQFFDATKKTHRTPTTDELKPVLKELGLTVDTHVVCYDYKDGMPACRAAFILSAMGFKEVRVLNCNFTHQYKKEATEQKSAKLTATAAAEIKLDMKFFATVEEVKKIAEGASSDQLIDCRSETAFKKGTIPKAKHLDYTKVWSNHQIKESSEVIKAFKDAGIDIEKPMIFTGALAATVGKAVADHLGFKSGKVFEMTFEEFKIAAEVKPVETKPVETKPVEAAAK